MKNKNVGFESAELNNRDSTIIENNHGADKNIRVYRLIENIKILYQTERRTDNHQAHSSC